MATRFAHPVEGELARIFDELGIAWEYEPTTFVLERDPDGTVREAFTPDFYLPEQEMYVECTTMRQKLTAPKNRKLRKLREQGVLVTVLYGATSSACASATAFRSRASSEGCARLDPYGA